MAVNLYKKYLSKERIVELKASELRDFEKEEETITTLAAAYLFSTFILFIALAAMIIWLNKFTIFLFVIALPPTALFCFSYFKSASRYKKKLKEFEQRGRRSESDNA